MIKRLALIAYSALILTMSVVYAAEANRLDVLGVAYVTDFDLGGDGLPVFPIPWPGGSYFRSTNLPAALTQGQEAWAGDTFTLDIIKPPSVANNGMNNFTMEFAIVNPTNYTWTGGTATAVIVSGVFSTVAASLSTTTVAPGQSVTITFSFRTKIDIESLDKTRITVSFMMAGKRRYCYIDVIMRPVGSAPAGAEEILHEEQYESALDFGDGAGHTTAPAALPERAADDLL
ncbi:MAG: hypothetical protein FWE69_01530 [Clostridiales bacterium]|nr:hypothetical protein [Clostridiales bacterium]